MNQRINCKVHSCQFNDNDNNHCTLKAIEVKGQPFFRDPKDKQETICSSYRLR